MARLSRRALVHIRGRMTDKPAKTRHRVRVEGGEFQIMAPDTKALLDPLKVRVRRFVHEAGRLLAAASWPGPRGI